MVLIARIEKQSAQKLKNFLLSKELFAKEFPASSDSKYVYFPIKEKFEFAGVKIIEKTIKKNTKELTLPKNIDMNRSYDRVGNIIILEIPRKVRKFSKKIADFYLKKFKVDSIYMKAGGHAGKFRVQKHKWIAGKKNSKTIHKEHGLSFEIDINKAYFSPRLAGERLRIANQIKNEDVLVMFSGIGFYPLVIKKLTKAISVIGIELNPNGHKMALANAKRNKLDVKFYCMDAKKAPKLGKFDRIIMPLPKSASLFLKPALDALKGKKMLHIYQFTKEDDFGKLSDSILDKLRKLGAKPKLISINKCGQQSPRVFRVCLDIRC